MKTKPGRLLTKNPFMCKICKIEFTKKLFTILRKTWKKTKTTEYIHLYVHIESARKKISIHSVWEIKSNLFFTKKTQSVYMDKNSLESGIQWVLTRWSRYFGFVYSKDFTFQTFFYQLKVEVLIFCYQMVLIFSDLDQLILQSQYFEKC